MMIAGDLAIIYLLPRVTRLVPSPLIYILVLNAIALAFGVDTRTVADFGALPDALPIILLPQVPLDLESLRIILPTAIAVAAVGLLESHLTASIVDTMTDRGSAMQTKRASFRKESTIWTAADSPLRAPFPAVRLPLAASRKPTLLTA